MALLRLRHTCSDHAVWPSDLMVQTWVSAAPPALLHRTEREYLQSTCNWQTKFGSPILPGRTRATFDSPWVSQSWKVWSLSLTHPHSISRAENIFAATPSSMNAKGFKQGTLCTFMRNCFFIASFSCAHPHTLITGSWYNPRDCRYLRFCQRLRSLSRGHDIPIWQTIPTRSLTPTLPLGISSMQQEFHTEAHEGLSCNSPCTNTEAYPQKPYQGRLASAHKHYVSEPTLYTSHSARRMSQPICSPNSTPTSTLNPKPHPKP